MRIANALLLAILVSLTAVMAFGGSACALSAGFAMNHSIGTASYQRPFVVQFTDRSSGATSWSWNFGDGTTSTLRNPVHAYNCSNQYNVTLTVRNSTATRTATGTVNVQLVINGRVANPHSYTLKELKNASNFKQIYVSAYYNKMGSGNYWYNVTGASLNGLLGAKGVKAYGNATKVTFYASDNFAVTVPISEIYGDNKSIVAYNCPPDGSLRDIIPSESPGAHNWTRDLVAITIS